VKATDFLLIAAQSNQLLFLIFVLFCSPTLF